MTIFPRRGACWILTLALATAAQLVSAADEPRFGGKSSALDQLKQGYGAMEEGAYAAAVEHYQAALEFANTRELRFQALVGRGSAEAALDRLADARVSFDRALEIKPENPEALFSAGMVAQDLKDFAAAAELLALAAVRDPAFGAAFTQLGIVYALEGRHEEAAASCRKAVSTDPQNVEAQLCLGVALYQLGRFDQASQAFDVVVAIDPRNSNARYSLGLCKLYGEDLEGAMREYSVLKDLDPDLARDLHDRINASRE